jgi:hypothetical protein
LVGFLPDRYMLGGLDPGPHGLWHLQNPSGVQGRYRMCVNYVTYKVCNWMVVEGDNHPYCLSCRLSFLAQTFSLFLFANQITSMNSSKSFPCVDCKHFLGLFYPLRGTKTLNLLFPVASFGVTA